jgi:CRISPR-associated protein Cmr4
MQQAFFIHALSPLHAGTGQAQGAIDLPIARQRGTGIPYLPGSSIKGVLRDASPDDPMQCRIFGPPVNLEEDDTRHAGALAFGDARLVALPVRSFHGTFAWVTSPLLLRLASRDLRNMPDLPAEIPKLGHEGQVAVTTESVLRTGDKVFLEEIDCGVQAAAGSAAGAWAKAIGGIVFHDDVELFAERFAVVDDETMTYLWECCTQVDARVRIDDKRGVVQDGALWYEESLPAETLLLGLTVLVKREPDPEKLFAYFLGKERSDLQFGGKATVGRGRARLVPAGVYA